MTRPLAPLEKLPAELLQQIFFLSLSVQLPRSSPVIAAKLSSEHVFQKYITLVLFSAENNNSGDPVKSKKRKSIRRILKNSKASEGEHELLPPLPAFDLLSSRFFTWQRFKASVEAALGPTSTSTSTALDIGIILDNPHAPGSPNSSASALRTTVLAQLSHLRILPLPPKLLRPPWDPDRGAFLYFLTYLGLRCAPSLVPLAAASLPAAISQRAPRAVAALISTRIGVPVTTEILRHAVLECGCDRTIVRLLLSAGSSQESPRIDYADAALERWREREKGRGNGRGAWLGARLKEARFGISRPAGWFGEGETGEGRFAWMDEDGILEEASVIPNDRMYE